jgi:hypothetical protein
MRFETWANRSSAVVSRQHVTVQDILNLLERHVNDKDIQQDIKNEQDEVPYVKASTGRLERDVYDTLIVGDYQERTRNRSAVRERQRKQYEVCFPCSVTSTDVLHFATP